MKFIVFNLFEIYVYIQQFCNIRAMDFIFTVFSHDYYIMELPQLENSQFYQTFPYYLQTKNYINKHIKYAPVMRLYGTHNSGQKACVHVHGYFPFIYIKCQQFSQAFLEKQFLTKFLSIVEALFQQAYKKKRPIIYKAETELKYDFYGYHSQKQLFLKIYLYDPMNITQMREIFCSRAINNKLFQCYEAHISYFMHFFADLNIFGLHQIILSSFKFRRNVDLIQKFNKIQTNFTKDKNLAQSTICLTTLSKNQNNLFSHLQKLSSCYLELDIHYHSIINYLYNLIGNSQQKSRLSMDSENISQIQINQDKLFKVQITKALNQFWYDQKQRRLSIGKDEEFQIYIDYSRNIESEKKVKNGQMQALWINFFNKTQNQKQLIKCVQSYRQSNFVLKKNQIFVQKYIIHNYEQVLRKQTQIMIQNVKKRWKFYGQRAKNLIQNITIGKIKQVPQWDSLTQKSQSSDQQQNEQQSQFIKSQKTVFDEMKEAQAIRNNMAIFRNNYKIAKGQLVPGTIFVICQYCKYTALKCKCVFKQKINDDYFQDKIIIEYYQFRSFLYKIKPPIKKQVLLTCKTQNQFPYYSDINDFFKNYSIPNLILRSKKNAQLLEKCLKIPKKFQNIITIKNEQKLPSFWRNQILNQSQTYVKNQYLKLIYSIKPPKVKILEERKEKNISMEIEQETQNSTKMQNIFACDITQITFQIISQCSHIYSNPQKDQLVGIIYSISNQACKPKKIYGFVGIKKYFQNSQSVFDNSNKITEVYYVNNQKDLILFFALVIFKVDPDLLITYDHQKRGIYYIIHRALLYQINFTEIISRATYDLDFIYEVVNFTQFQVIKCKYITKQILISDTIQKTLKNSAFNKQSLKNMIDRISAKKKKRPILRKNYVFNINVKGRVQINIYRICQFQLKLKSYTLQNVFYHLFQSRLPQFTDKYLSEELKTHSNYVIKYYEKRVEAMHKILDKINVIGAVIQKSKLYGCNFASMLQRGSQFKIQAIMCRVSRQSQYLLLSASKMQVAQQSLLECRPLVLQPPKQMFCDPVLVFDFQSLYPSIMISHNICYSTCLGSIKQLFNKQTKKKKFGVSQGIQIDFSFIQQIVSEYNQQEAIQKLKKYIFITPNKVAFVKQNIRQGIIPRILLQFLMSRIMMKDSSKLYQNPEIHKLLHQRQIAIKLFMNVMYGYTGASFSGRMPSAQIADSVVQLAKFSLKTCIDFIHDNPKYGGKVIYGDTDSIFYHLKGKSMKQAFQIGQQIAKVLTKKFPFPMQLKFQKVYQSLVLVSKKRYYGKKYEKFNGTAKYEGKGLQCVRRDGIDITVQIMKNTLNQVFDVKDMSQIKDYFLHQYSKIKSGLKTQLGFCLSKQVKLLKYGELMPAHGVAAKQLQSIDPMLLPKYGQRMKYLVLKGISKRVKDNVISLFLYKNQQLDYDYYLQKLIIPPMQRTFTSLLNINDWIIGNSTIHNNLNKHTFAKNYCIICSKKDISICFQCLIKIDQKIKQLTQEIQYYDSICRNCIGNKNIDFEKCVQWNCQILYKRRRVKKQNEGKRQILQLLKQGLKKFYSQYEKQK